MNDGDSELLAAAARVVGAFNELGVDYFVGGSLASSVFGEPRQTIDADLIARLLARQAGPLVEKLAGEFYVELEAVLAAVRTQGSFNLIHLENMTKVDVFVRWRSTFAQSQFARRQRNPSVLPRRSNSSLPRPRIPSSPNYSGIAREAESRTVSGATSLGFSRSRLNDWIWLT